MKDCRIDVPLGIGDGTIHNTIVAAMTDAEFTGAETLQISGSYDALQKEKFILNF